MQNDIIDMIEPTPQLNSKKCKIISFVLWMILRYSLYVITLIALLKYDFFVAIATLLVSFIIMGIIRSYIRNGVIPPTQREYHYTDKEIANWHTAKILCDDKLEIKLEEI